MHASQGFPKKNRFFVDKQAYLLIKTDVFSVLSAEYGRFVDESRNRFKEY